jgi:hypothetical protein
MGVFRPESTAYYRNRRVLSKDAVMRFLSCINSALLAAALLAVPAAADDAPNLDAICAKTPCRAGGYFALVSADASHFVGVEVGRSPYLLENGSLLIFPGETIAVTFALDGDKLKPIAAKRYAPHLPLPIARAQGDKPQANADDNALPAVGAKLPADEVASLPPNTLLVSYGQLKPQGESSMVLTLNHNLPHTLKLDAIVAEIQSGSSVYRQHYTTTCPVVPKIWDNESWPMPLGPLVLTRFRLQQDSPTIVCD